jgi:hypothetical protein
MVDLLAQNVPRGSTREDRIVLLIAAAYALQTGAPVPPAAARLLGDALMDWLQNGGRLEHRLKVSRRGDHNNVPRLAARLVDLAIPSSTMRDDVEKISESLTHDD